MSRVTTAASSTTRNSAQLTSVWKGCSFLSLDPGINHTGFAHYYINDDHSLQLRNFGAISAPENDEPLLRVGHIVDAAAAHVRTCKPAFVFIERPPDTVYYQGRCSPGMLVARAQSVFKVIGVTYSLYTRLRESLGTSLFLIDPVKWQERSKKKRDGLDIKDWSLRLANSIIIHHSQVTNTLHTHKDENIADAISMGYIAYKSGLAAV